MEAGTTSHGLVIRGWAPQLEVAATGVAMLAWPMSTDQFMDAWQHGGTQTCAEVAQQIG